MTEIRLFLMPDPGATSNDSAASCAVDFHNFQSVCADSRGIKSARGLLSGEWYQSSSEERFMLLMSGYAIKLSAEGARCCRLLAKFVWYVWKGLKKDASQHHRKEIECDPGRNI